MMSDARKRAAPTLQRVAFKTSRLAEFCGEKELIAQTGHAPDDWPLVIAKELTDNALDACEEAEIPPEIIIEVSTERCEIIIADNGPGLPTETLEGVLDYNVRVSSREAYVSPSRGQQGNALKCIIAMPFALDGTCGTTVIESRGQACRIVFVMDPVRREPRILLETVPSDIQNGTRITVRWPQTACHLIEAAKHRFVQMVCAFTTFNPHLTISVSWDDEEFVNVLATYPDWQKWRTCDSTSAHWYGVGEFERYMAAHLARDEDQGRTGRTVRDFIAELRGLARSGKQKLVLADTETSGVALATFFASGSSAIAALLASCQRHTKPVRPEDLGLIGAEHLLKGCMAAGAAAQSFKYRKHIDAMRNGLPYAIEAAFAYCPDGGSRRQLITGVNFSVGIGSPFERLGPFSGLTSVAARQHVDHDDPVVLVVHYTCPRVDFADRGKGTLALPYHVADKMEGLVKAVTADWAKQRRAELRSDAAEAKRRERLLKQSFRSRKPQNAVIGSGVLFREIDAAAAATGSSIQDLTVLSPKNDPYRLDTAEGHQVGQWFADQVARLLGTTGRVHLRGLFYRIVAVGDVEKPDGETFTNTYENWVWLTARAAKAARWLDYVPFERIRDERNEKPRLFLPERPPADGDGAFVRGIALQLPDIGAVLPHLSAIAPRGRQPYRIAMIGEKSSLQEVLLPIAELVEGELLLPTGEATETMIAELAERAATDGRPTVVLYFSDFDPAGWQMPISVARKLQALRTLRHADLKVQVHRVALTLDQVRQFDLPSTPLKPTEKRAPRWRQIMGREQTEIDALAALRPDDLRQIALDAVSPFFDFTLAARCEAARQAWLTQAQAKIADHPAFAAAREKIAKGYARAERAVAALRALQADTHRELAMTLGVEDAAIPAPAAQLEAPAAAPLINTEHDFAATSRRLIAEKKYEAEEKS